MKELSYAFRKILVTLSMKISSGTLTRITTIINKKCRQNLQLLASMLVSILMDRVGHDLPLD